MDDRTGRVDVPNTTADAERAPDARAREIRAEIERAREDLSETVDAIQEKLRPGNLVASAASGAADKVKDLASTATEKVKDMASTTTEKVKDMASNAAGTTEDWWEANSDSGVLGRIRSNPLPAVLAGVGLTWLVFSEGGSTRRGARGSNGGSQSPSDRAPDYARSHSILQAGAPRRAAADARATFDSGRYRLESMIRDYPLAVGAAALLIGASLGMAVPETERENEWMGEAREGALQRAQDAASEAVGRVKDAATEVVGRATSGD